MARDNGMRKTLLAHAFCIRELNLYLDTHPNDTRALQEFNKCRDEFEKLKGEYVANGGIWSVTDSDCTEHFEWINSPWPWEYTEEV